MIARNTALPVEETAQETTEFVAEMEDRVVAIDRISRTVKGGRRIRFRALVVIGNRAGLVGVGVAIYNEQGELLLVQ